MRSIGVSNFGEPHLEKLLASAIIPPAVNQIEVLPFLQRRDLVRYCQSKGVVVEVRDPCLLSSFGALASQLAFMPTLHAVSSCG